MKLDLDSAIFIKFSTWISDFVSASVQCSFANNRRRYITTKQPTVEDILQPNLHSISSIVKPGLYIVVTSR